MGKAWVVAGVAAAVVVHRIEQYRAVDADARSAGLLVPRVRRNAQVLTEALRPTPTGPRPGWAGDGVRTENIEQHTQARYHTPEREPGDTAVLWFHGGGLVMGTPDSNDNVCRQLARDLGVPVLAAGYRLAGQAPFPAALDDAVGWHDYLVTQGFRRIIVGGTSAGGGIAAALAQLLVDAGRPPAFQILIHPMLDDRTQLRPTPGRGVFAWNKLNNHVGWSAYLRSRPGRGAKPRYAVPARRDNYEGLPPAFISVGSQDLFFDEDVRYANSLIDAGVWARLHVVVGGIHGDIMEHWASAPYQQLWRSLLGALAEHGVVQEKLR
ncbi:Acetyl esterase/lipase [Corynebacterium timonense]|uniref:Acetyl esterase/lipase n=2 Tax=Corynebacterium timonense TaxID=441500 RepID=A0A1H1VHN6_9CORY|nr:Acetyl esterase/lipase [Corynebacterium timonense]